MSDDFATMPVLELAAAVHDKLSDVFDDAPAAALVVGAMMGRLIKEDERASKAEKALATYQKIAVADGDSINALRREIQDREMYVQKMEDTVNALGREIEVLRQFGNKSCTAMADEFLEEERAEKGD